MLGVGPSYYTNLPRDLPDSRAELRFSLLSGESEKMDGCLGRERLSPPVDVNEQYLLAEKEKQ